MEYQLTQVKMNYILNIILHNIDVGEQPEVVSPQNKQT